MAQDANYLEERVLKPLQHGIALLREAESLAVTITQRQSQVDSMNKELAILTRKKQEMQDSLEAMRTNLTEQRNDLQALLRSDEADRQRRVTEYEREKEKWADEKRGWQQELTILHTNIKTAEQHLDRLKTDLSTRLQALQGLAR